MDRRKLLVFVFGVFPLSVACVIAKEHGDNKGKGKDKGGKHDHDEHERSGARAARYFRREDFVVVQRYYTGPRDLPPGLRKKYYRTGTLPPGWQKKLRPFPPELIRVLPPPPVNCEFGYIDGTAIVYDRTTRIILDSIDLIAAIAGR
jgi:hypothetical protein